MRDEYGRYVRGVKRGPLKLETRVRQSVALLGKPRLNHRGEKHWNWRGGITSMRAIIWGSIEMKNWRKAVYERDNYTCVLCGIRGVKLNADHIKPFALFPELRFSIDNGRTLCVPCHRKTPTYGHVDRDLRNGRFLPIFIGTVIP